MRPPFHKNCKCLIIDGELILDKDACDYCKKIKRENFSKNNISNMKHVKLKVNKKDWEKFKVSYVQDPAMEGEDFKYFSKELQFSEAKIDKEKGLVTGLMVRPDKIIPRINKFTKEQYTVSFDPEEVEDMSQQFYIHNRHTSTTFEHAFDIEGSTLVYSEIIRDENVNSAKAQGFSDVKVGDWWGTFKVNNEELVNNYIKTGLIKGFSIEGAFMESILDSKEEEEFSNLSDEDLLKFIEDNLKDENIDMLIKILDNRIKE